VGHRKEKIAMMPELKSPESLLHEAREMLQQERVHLQVVGRDLTPKEQHRSDMLGRALPLLDEALGILEPKIPSKTTFSGLVYVTHGRVDTKSEGPDYHLQTFHRDYLLRYKERYLWEPDYHLEFFGRRMVKVEGKPVEAGVIQVESIQEICVPLIPKE
jgi:hypothetical protein